MTPTPRAWAICTLAFCMTSAVIFAAGTLVPRPSDPDSRARAAGPVKSDVVLPAPGTVLPADQPPREPRIVERSVTLAAPRARGLLTPGNASDFSGNWALVSSTYTGRGRGGGGGSGSEVMVSIASGAPVNCGTGCTIVQDTKALTITRPDQPGETPPDIGVVQLNLDGSDSTITQANGTTFPAKATLEGGTVIVTRHFNYSSVKQTLSIEDGRLIVVTIFSLADAPVTLRYVKR